MSAGGRKGTVKMPATDLLAEVSRFVDTPEWQAAAAKSSVLGCFTLIRLNPAFKQTASPQQWGALAAAIQAHDARCERAQVPKFGVTLRSMAKAAAALPFLFPQPIPLLLPEADDAASQAHLQPTTVFTKLQCYAVMCASFLCLWPRGSFDHANELPGINLDEMHSVPAAGQGFGQRGGNCVEEQKLQMFIEYFVKTAVRWEKQDPCMSSADDAIVFQRRGTTTQALKPLLSKPLIPPVTHALRESIDEQKTMLRADFANEVIGGAAMSFGCVQEEIMFAICPEMCVARLVCATMRPHESILMLRCEQFAFVRGYAFSLQYGGKYDDPAPRKAIVAAIDALDFRSLRRSYQYKAEAVDREIVKAAAGFGILDGELPAAAGDLAVPREVATGNWGCGAFLGDVELKCLQQWVVASMFGKTMHYFPFDNEHVARNFPPLAAALCRSQQAASAAAPGVEPASPTRSHVASGGAASAVPPPPTAPPPPVTCGELLLFMRDVGQPGLFEAVQARFGSGAGAAKARAKSPTRCSAQ